MAVRRVGADDLIEGAPELVGEVAASSAAIDLHQKMEIYRRSGVREYIVWRAYDRAIDCFELRGDEFVRRDPDDSGVFRSGIFPGLWLDAAALLRGDVAGVLRTLQAGLASLEHAAFIERLNAAAQ